MGHESVEPVDVVVLLSELVESEMGHVTMIGGQVIIDEVREKYRRFRIYIQGSALVHLAKMTLLQCLGTSVVCSRWDEKNVS